MNYIVLQSLVFIGLLMLLSVPLGIYIFKVMDGQKVLLSPIVSPIEKCVLKLVGQRNLQEMDSKEYSLSVLAFSAISFIVLLLIQLLQNFLPLNPQQLPAVTWHQAINTAASFVTNTNWQSYSGETTMSYFTQTIGLTVQNFLSAALGISVLFVLIRGFTQRQNRHVGNFWLDMTRVTLYVLLPLSFVVALILCSQGVVQTFSGYRQIETVQHVLQMIPLGPAASQIAIKQLGTNGGGFFGANSAFPFENPTALTNLIEMLCILLIPSALVVSFGKAVKDMKQARSIYAVMLVLFVFCLGIVSVSEFSGLQSVAGVVSGINMEGKEAVHGIGASSLWATATTAASNGSVNAMLDSFTPIAGMLLMFLMQLGEIVFGGVGSGLYGMLAFVVLTVFIAGLMIGRTPEYLGKKIEPFDMKMVCVIVIIPPLVTLIGTAAAMMMPQAVEWLSNTGAHGFSEILYAFTSMGNNNGSAFSGFISNTLFTDITGAIIMLIVRYVPMVAVISLAGNLSAKKMIASGAGTLSTSSGLFSGLLLAIIIIIGALTFLPALALGPIADHLINYR